jgi:two-component system clock-associated histidine kinase SasA
MNLFYEGGPLLSFGLNLILAFFVLRQNFHGRLNQVFSFFLLTMGLWAFSVYGMRHSPDLQTALPWEKATLFILPLVVISFYRFAHLLGGAHYPRWRILAGYLAILISLALAPTALLVRGMQDTWYGMSFQPGVLLIPYLLISYGIIVLALVQLIRDYRNQHSIIEKSRYVYILTGGVIFVVGIIIDTLAARGVRIYPLGIFSNIMFSILCGYAILRYQLLDIPVIIRKGTTYILVSAVGIGLYMGLLLLAYAFVSGVWGLPLWANIFFILVFAIVLQPLLRWTQNRVDRWFYRGRYDYLNALERLAEETKTITDLNFIAESLVSTIKRAMQSLNVSVLLPDTEGKNYTSVPGKNDSTQRPISLEKSSILIWWLGHNRNYLTNQDLEVMPQFKALTAQESRMIRALDAELFMPLITREGLRGILIVGKKMSQLDYTAEEIKLLGVVASQMATAFENARLFELQTRRYREQALLARLSMTIASELDFSKVYDSFMREIQEIMSVDYSALMVLDESGTQLAAKLEFGRVAELKLADIDKLLLSEKLPRGEDVDYEGDVAQLPESPLRHRLVGEGLNSLLILPLTSKSHGIGYLALASQRMDAYNEDYIRLLKQVAVQLAIAYEKSRLYELERKVRLELEKQDKERTEFINSLIHEIKTPITAMLASSDLLYEELSSNPGILSELAGNLDTSIGNLNRRVSELTDFAKLQNTEIKISLETVDMLEMLQKAESLVSNLLQTRDQILSYELNASRHLVRADPDRVIQIMLNLLTNASKYGKPFKNINVKTYNQDKFLVTEIKDSSPPIIVKEGEELFSPYHLARRKESGGLGLGLFICKRLVELHGGVIWLETDSDGNRLKFSLPLVTEKEAN